VRVEVPAAAARAPAPPALAVDAVIPCYNRPADLARLLADLAALDLHAHAPGAPAPARIDLRVVIVDNASEPALDRVAAPPGLDAAILRLPSNTGGSGGFNAGLVHALRRAPPAPYLWLLDSDARVRPGTLARLVEALESRPGLAAAGSAIADPATGTVFECGGRVDRRTGRFEPARRGAAGLPPIVECDYVAACSALVRREAVERAGLLPDVFLNGDDAEWCIRIARATGRRVAAVPASVVLHPAFDRFPTWARYYVARNAFGPIDALDLGPRARFRRALREVARAAAQAMMGRHDLAALHRRGLADAAAGRVRGPAAGPAGDPALPFEPFHPFAALAAHLIPVLGPRARGVRVAVHPALGLGDADSRELDRQLARACEPFGGLVAVPPAGPLRRLRPRARPDVAVVPARGRPSSWLAGRIVVAVTPQGFVVRRPRLRREGARATLTAARGLWCSIRLAARRPRRLPAPIPALRGDPPATPRVGALIVSHNRRDAIGDTLRHLTDAAGLEPASIVVADNASTDGTPERIAAEFPAVGLLRGAANRGVEAFNLAAARLLDGPDAPDAILVLDDDARPDADALRAALDLFARRPDVGAVTFHPRHPATGRSEWPFAALASPDGEDHWPVMGCANLVRAWAWRRLGGYAAEFFLYRNDTDLALSLLGAGIPVHFNPAWVVRHDSPAARRKSVRWHRLATRNWAWVARRHGRGGAAAAALLLGWLWSHRLAGLSARRHAATLRGVAEGLVTPPPPPPPGVNRAWSAEQVRRLVRLHVMGRRVR
jgi:GT2 family glycosyltransferase